MLPVLRKRNEFPGLFNGFFDGDVFPGFFLDFDKRSGTPAVNIVESKDDYRIEVAAPGLDKSYFKIYLENNVLTISAEKEDKQEEKNERYMRREFNYSSFSRSFTIPDTMNGEKISAEHKDGVLHVIIPKKEEAKEKPAHTIKIL
jgi:HSP20 family protein